MVLCSSLLEMCVQSLKLIHRAIFILELIKCSPPRNHSLAKFLQPWKLQHQILFKMHFLIKLPSVKFLLKSLMSNKSILEKKVNICTLSGYFPFFISFFCWNEIGKKSSIKVDMRKMENCKTNHILDRSSCRRCSVRKDVLKNFAKFLGKHLCQDLFMSELKASNFIKKRRLWYKCFPVNFAKFWRTPFLQNTSGQLLLFRVNRVSDYYTKASI